MLLLPILLILLAQSIYQLFKRRQFKVVFEAEVTDYLGVIFLNWILVNGVVGRLSPLPFSYRVNQIQKGNVYRFHKLPDRNLLLRIEEIV